MSFLSKLETLRLCSHVAKSFFLEMGEVVLPFSPDTTVVMEPFPFSSRWQWLHNHFISLRNGRGSVFVEMARGAQLRMSQFLEVVGVTQY